MLLDFDHIVTHYNIKSKGIIHIGAHYGFELYQYLKHQIKKILMFEPQEKAFKQLQFNISQIKPSYNVRIDTEKMALGNFKGEVDMFVEKENMGMSSSILEPEFVSTQYPQITFKDKERVKINTLDDYLNSATRIGQQLAAGAPASAIDAGDAPTFYDFINIDVQGYELEVFKGALKTLKNVNYIITEVNREELYKECAKVEELDSFLGEFGFKRELTSWEGQTWGDAFYLKR